MSLHAYICSEMKLMDSSIAYAYGAAQSLEKDGKCILDSRSGLAMPLIGGVKFNMEMYFNYIQSLRKIASMERTDTVLSLAQMGFIPVLCEPSFTNGAYAKYLMPMLENSGLPLYRRKPMSFTSRPSDMSGVDIWVHKQDCVDVLHLSGRAEHVTVREVYKRLGVTDNETDVRRLC